jgi:hypothetical protein
VNIEGDNTYEREERVRDMKKLRLEKINISRHLKNAEEDHQIALNTVDNKDEDATADDREQVEVASEEIERQRVLLDQNEIALSQAIELSIQMRRKLLMSSKYRPDAAIEVARLFPRNNYQVMFHIYTYMYISVLDVLSCWLSSSLSSPLSSSSSPSSLSSPLLPSPLFSGYG